MNRKGQDNWAVAKKGGWTPLPPEERKVGIWCHVKRKHWAKAKKEIDELVKKYR